MAPADCHEVCSALFADKGTRALVEIGGDGILDADPKHIRLIAAHFAEAVAKHTRLNADFGKEVA